MSTKRNNIVAGVISWALFIALVLGVFVVIEFLGSSSPLLYGLGVVGAVVYGVGLALGLFSYLDLMLGLSRRHRRRRRRQHEAQSAPSDP